VPRNAEQLSARRARGSGAAKFNTQLDAIPCNGALDGLRFDVQRLFDADLDALQLVDNLWSGLQPCLVRREGDLPFGCHREQPHTAQLLDERRLVIDHYCALRTAHQELNVPQERSLRARLDQLVEIVDEELTQFGHLRLKVGRVNVDLGLMQLLCRLNFLVQLRLLCINHLFDSQATLCHPVRSLASCVLAHVSSFQS
jgi:hypothetical protein